MAKVKAASLASSINRSISKRENYAMLCYYYPQYTLKDAQRIPARDLILLISTARKIEARKMYSLTQIVAAPHTNKGRGVKKLTEFYKKQSK